MMKNINPNLKYNFNTNAKLEIQLRSKNRMGDKVKTKYVPCTPNVFRSFHGKRRIDGKPFKGQVYCFDSNAIYGVNAFADASPTKTITPLRKDLVLHIVKNPKGRNLRMQVTNRIDNDTLTVTFRTI